MKKGKPESQKNGISASTFHISPFGEVYSERSRRTQGKLITFYTSRYLSSALFLNLLALSVLSNLFIVSVLAQETIRIRSHQFDRNNITVGDTVQLRLLIEADEDLHLYLVPMELNHLQGVEVEPPKVKRVKFREAGLDEAVANKALYEIVYPLRAFAPGKHALAPIIIQYTDAHGNHASIQTPAYPFEVRAVKPADFDKLNPADATEIKGIKPPLSPPRSPFAYIVMGVLLLGIFILLYLRKRFQPTDVPIVTPIRHPPHEVASERLKQIEAMNLVAQERMKEYHTEISQVIRQYIEAQYNIPALELTTEDLLERLRHTVIEDGTLSLIRFFFAHCNLVKFAKYQPGKPEAYDRMDEARAIIDRTRQAVTTHTF